MARTASLIQAPPLLLSRDLRAAAQQALDALIHMCHNTVAEKGYDGQRVQNAIDGLEAALAQQEQEPCKRHNPCERLPDGYCARCHSEMYP